MSKLETQNIPGKWGLLAKYDDDVIRFLIDRKFPSLKRISNAPRPALPVGSRAPRGRLIVEAGKLTPTAAQEVELYEAELLRMSLRDRYELFERETAKAADERGKLAEVERKLQEKKLFGEWAAADFRLWLRVALWNRYEAIDLSLGKEPSPRFGWNYISTLLRVSEFARAYEKRRLLIYRAVESTDLSNPMRPSQFVEWAASVALEVPGELKANTLTATADASDQTSGNLSASPVGTSLATSKSLSQYDSRSDELTAVIEIAIKQAVDGADSNSVWAALFDLANSDKRPAPLLGCGDGEIKYLSRDDVKFFSKRNLADRLRRRLRRRQKSR